MNIKILFCLSVALFVIAEVSGRSCHGCGQPHSCHGPRPAGPCQGCGFGRGQDYCKECVGTPYEFRPVSVKPTKGHKLYPVEDDLCDCRNVKVQPVALPKPKYIWKEKKPEVCDKRPLIPAPDHHHDFTQDEEIYEINPDFHPSGCNFQPLYPVDAVSIDLVNRMKAKAKQAIPESQLQYGFFKLPRDVVNYKINSQIPEEKLNTFDRHIVELKSPKQVVNCGSDEHVLEEREGYPTPYLSYKDLGFVPESAQHKKFVNACRHSVPHRIVKEKHYPESSEEEDIKYEVKRSSCGCQKKKGKKSPCGCH